MFLTSSKTNCLIVSNAVLWSVDENQCSKYLRTHNKSSESEYNEKNCRLSQINACQILLFSYFSSWLSIFGHHYPRLEWIVLFHHFLQLIKQRRYLNWFLFYHIHIKHVDVLEMNMNKETSSRPKEQLQFRRKSTLEHLISCVLCRNWGGRQEMSNFRESFFLLIENASMFIPYIFRYFVFYRKLITDCVYAFAVLENYFSLLINKRSLWSETSINYKFQLLCHPFFSVLCFFYSIELVEILSGVTLRVLKNFTSQKTKRTPSKIIFFKYLHENIC